MSYHSVWFVQRSTHSITEPNECLKAVNAPTINFGTEWTFARQSSASIIAAKIFKYNCLFKMVTTMIFKYNGYLIVLTRWFKNLRVHKLGHSYSPNKLGPNKLGSFAFHCLKKTCVLLYLTLVWSQVIWIVYVEIQHKARHWQVKVKLVNTKLMICQYYITALSTLTNFVLANLVIRKVSA